MQNIVQRQVVVVSGGWVFAGDVTADDNNLTLDRAVHVVRWQSVGFAGMIDAGATSDDVTLTLMGSLVVIPHSSVLFRVPVPSDWGLPS